MTPLTGLVAPPRRSRGCFFGSPPGQRSSGRCARCRPRHNGQSPQSSSSDVYTVTDTVRSGMEGASEWQMTRWSVPAPPRTVLGPRYLMWQRPPLTRRRPRRKGPSGDRRQRRADRWPRYRDRRHLAASLPETKAEAAVIGPAADGAKRAAGSALQSGFEEVKETAMSVADAAVKGWQTRRLAHMPATRPNACLSPWKVVADGVGTAAVNPSHNSNI